MTHNQEQSIARAEECFRHGDLEEARRSAFPIIEDFYLRSEPLPPRLERLLGVFVALSNGVPQAIELLDQPLSPL